MVKHNNVNNNINIINNEKGFTKTHNDNDNVAFNRAEKAEIIARKLSAKFGSDKSFEFYCKVAYALPENKIWINYEKSLGGKNPGALFNWLCRKDMT